MKTLRQAQEELAEAFKDLAAIIVQASRIDRFADWLSRHMWAGLVAGAVLIGALWAYLAWLLVVSDAH